LEILDAGNWVADNETMLNVLPFPRSDRPSTALARPATSGTLALPAITSVDLYGALLADASNPRTHRARKQDVADLGRFLGQADPGAACAPVVAGNAGYANAIAMGYKRKMLDRGLSANTINRRLSTLRHLVKVARRLGMVDWAIDIDGMKAEAYRDTAGPGPEGWRQLVATARAAGDKPKALRDRVLLRLFRENGLRRGEIEALDIGDVDLAGARIAVVGKGRTQRRWLTLNEPTVEALRAWLEVRGSTSGPLFTNFAPGHQGPDQRLSGHGLYYIIRTLGRDAGLGRAVRPHGLRHEGITRALEVTNGNYRKVQQFSRHADANTIAIYDDNREDLAGQVTRLLGADA